MNANQKTVTVKLKRGDLCTLLVGLNAICDTSGTSERFKIIRDNLRDQLHSHDEKMLNENQTREG